MSDFRLQIESLDERPESLEFQAPAAWWSDRAPASGSAPCDVETPFGFALAARRTGENVIIEGDVSGRVGLECSRCAKRYPHVLREVFRLVLEPAKGDEPTDPEGEQGLSRNGLCLGEDLEAGWYRGPVIRLDEFFGELIALAMPLQPLCSEDCPGICPHCGADLAETRCDCTDEKIDSPFAVLARLKGELEGETEER